MKNAISRIVRTGLLSWVDLLKENGSLPVNPEGLTMELQSIALSLLQASRITYQYAQVCRQLAREV